MGAIQDAANKSISTAAGFFAFGPGKETLENAAANYKDKKMAKTFTAETNKLAAKYGLPQSDETGNFSWSEEDIAKLPENERETFFGNLEQAQTKKLSHRERSFTSNPNTRNYKKMMEARKSNEMNLDNIAEARYRLANPGDDQVEAEIARSKAENVRASKADIYKNWSDRMDSLQKEIDDFTVKAKAGSLTEDEKIRIMEIGPEIMKFKKEIRDNG